MTTGPAPYAADLAYVHHTGFAALANGAAPAIVERLRRGPVPVRHVWDVGCGSGLLARALLAAGFEVTAVDPSPAMIDLTRASAPSARIVTASAYEIEFDRGDAIVALGEPLTYHDPDADAVSRVGGFFERAGRALPPGGQLIFDLIETGTPSLTARGWASGPDWAVLTSTVEDAGRRRLTRSIETFRSEGSLYRRRSEVHEVALFDTAWVAASLEAAGFAVESAQCYGTHPLAPRRRAFFATRR